MINRRHFLRTTAASSMIAGPFLKLLARSEPFAPVKPVRGGVSYFTERGGTIGVYVPESSGSGGGVIIDTQFPESAQMLADQLGDQLRKSGDLELLFNTHHHGDHTSGNGVFSPFATQHVSHERAKANLADNLAKDGKTGEVPLPSATFTDEWSYRLSDGKEIVTAKHFGPAHTGGDACLHFENANVVHVGDLLFNRRFPYIDPGAGGDILNWEKVIKKVRKHYDKDTIYIFGHAAESYPVTGDRNDIKAFENYLRSLRKYVKKQKKMGTSVTQLVEKTSVIPGAPSWRQGEKQLALNLEVMFAAV